MAEEEGEQGFEENSSTQTGHSLGDSTSEEQSQTPSPSTQILRETAARRMKNREDGGRS